MVGWQELRQRKLASLSEADQAAYAQESAAAETRLDLAEALYRARQTAGLSQSELARRAGTTQAQISLVENGGRTPRLETLRRIAEALGLTLTVELKPAA